MSSLANLLYFFNGLNEIFVSSGEVRYDRRASAIIGVFPTFFLVNHSTICARNARHVRAVRRRVNEFRATLNRSQFRHVRFRLNHFAARDCAGIIACCFVIGLVRRFKGGQVSLAQRGKQAKLRNQRVSFTRPTAQTKYRGTRIVTCLVRFCDCATRDKEMACRAEDIEDDSCRVVNRASVRSDGLPRDHCTFTYVFQLNNSSNSSNDDSRVSNRRILDDGIRILSFVLGSANGAVRHLSRHRQRHVFRLNTPRLSRVYGLFTLSSRDVSRLLGVFRRFRIHVVRASVGDNQVDIVNELQAIGVVVKQAVLVFPAFVSRRLRYTINCRLINVRINNDSNSALSRICQRLIVVFPFRGFFAYAGGNVYLLFNRRSGFGIDRDNSRLNGNRYVSGWKVLAGVVFTGTRILCSPGNLCTVWNNFKCFAFACWVALYADYFQWFFFRGVSLLAVAFLAIFAVAGLGRCYFRDVRVHGLIGVLWAEGDFCA